MGANGRIFMVDDDELILSALTTILKKTGYEVQSESSTDDIISKIESWCPDILLLDIGLPGRNGIDILQELKERHSEIAVVMLTADDSAETAIRALKLGAEDYLTKPFNMDEVKIVLQYILEKTKLKDQVSYLRKVGTGMFEDEMVAESLPMQEMSHKIAKFAEAKVSTVLITGDSGTGKEMVAKWLHEALYACKGLLCTPFIPLNCTAMPEHIFESELFGHVRGAFTDAKTDKKGLFELAQDGTILLDEIGDMKLSLQGKLLRVLEERTVRRVGGKTGIPINATVIATTNVDLAMAVEEGRFRKDLYFRLNTFSLHLLCLRERKSDILPLANHFLNNFAGQYKKKVVSHLSPEAEQALLAYSWPGNIRELRNMVERIVVLESAEIITPEHLPFGPMGTRSGPQGSGDRYILPKEGVYLEGLEKDLISQALARAGNNHAMAAKLLGMSYDTLRYRLKKHNFDNNNGS